MSRTVGIVSEMKTVSAMASPSRESCLLTGLTRLKVASGGFPDRFVCLLAVETVHNQVVFVLDFLGLVLVWLGLQLRAPKN